MGGFGKDGEKLFFGEALPTEEFRISFFFFFVHFILLDKTNFTKNSFHIFLKGNAELRRTFVRENIKATKLCFSHLLILIE